MSIHKKISFIKSTIRLLGYVAGWYSSIFADSLQMANCLAWTFGILFVSELVGVIEELGEK